jgi:predicted AAA+ superfamily ATPase
VNNQLYPLLQTLLEEFEQKIAGLKDIIPRKIQLPKIKNKIHVAVGMRRSGKTYFLLQQIKKLLKTKTPISRILYLNFEDDRLLPATRDKLAELIEAFYTLYPANHNHLCYLFLDEIQNVTDWPITIRRIFDTKKVQIYLTGSSAKLLSKEIATSLRGRSITTEIWPYSFDEYLLAKNIPTLKKPFGKKSLDQMSHHLHNYLLEGGFPETISTNLINRFRLLQDYVNVVVFRDIIERYRLSNIPLIKYLIKSLLRNIGSGFSVNKFYNDLKSQGIPISKSTIYEYLAYIEDTYLAFSVPLYAESLRKTQTNPRKIYAIDTGLTHAYAITFSPNFGHLFENLVYLDLRRQNHEVYYYLTANRYEVDFFTKDIKGKPHLYQIVYNSDKPEIMQRETRALSDAERELGIKGKIITFDSYINNTLQDII